MFTSSLGLDAYEIVQGLVTHPGLKPHQRRQAEALLKDIKANLENSDDEGETSALTTNKWDLPKRLQDPPRHLCCAQTNTSGSH
ncbi:hypothetical protein PSHT_16129 [Puccinia striiformis]|uniref:Uncharacterized protein n=1 Tax=Puccinia striiformis TaxID=27350 RepID=A0A2S4UBE1_9BASI|nr:hypothetical protein PSHT_16129 [Puccinia striiformis]